MLNLLLLSTLLCGIDFTSILGSKLWYIELLRTHVSLSVSITSITFNIRLPNCLRHEYIRNFEFINYVGYVHTLENYFRFSLRLL